MKCLNLLVNEGQRIQIHAIPIDDSARCSDADTALAITHTTTSPPELVVFSYDDTYITPTPLSYHDHNPYGSIFATATPIRVGAGYPHVHHVTSEESFRAHEGTLCLRSKLFHGGGLTGNASTKKQSIDQRFSP